MKILTAMTAAVLLSLGACQAIQDVKTVSDTQTAVDKTATAVAVVQGDSPDYHGIDAGIWPEMEADYRRNEIYNRTDTLEIWRKENE